MIDHKGVYDTSSTYSRVDEPDVIATLREVCCPAFVLASRSTGVRPSMPSASRHPPQTMLQRVLFLAHYPTEPFHIYLHPTICSIMQYQVCYTPNNLLWGTHRVNKRTTLKYAIPGIQHASTLSVCWALDTNDCCFVACAVRCTPRRIVVWPDLPCRWLRLPYLWASWKQAYRMSTRRTICGQATSMRRCMRWVFFQNGMCKPLFEVGFNLIGVEGRLG